MNAAPRLPGLQQSRCLPGSGRSNGRQASRRLPFMLPKEKSPVSVGWGASLSNRGSGLLLRSVISGWSVSTGWSDLANGGPASRWVRVLLFARGATSAILNWSSQRPRCASPAGCFFRVPVATAPTFSRCALARPAQVD